MQAKAFLEMNKGIDRTDELIAQNAALTARLDAMQAQMSKLVPPSEQAAETQGASPDAVRRGPGRPPKQSAA